MNYLNLYTFFRRHKKIIIIRFSSFNPTLKIVKVYREHEVTSQTYKNIKYCNEIYFLDILP